MGYQRSSEASMWENPYADILVNSGLNRALAIQAEMRPSYPRLPGFIRVHQRHWIFVEIFRLAKPNYEWE